VNAVEVLRGLNDVDGVVGGFAGGADGQVLASSLPPFIAQADLGSAMARLARIFQCSSECNVDADSGLLRFDDYKLFTNRYDWGVLCVIAEAKTNARILRMATRIAAKHMPEAIKADHARLNPAPPPEPPPLPPPLPASAEDSARHSQPGSAPGFSAVPSAHASGQHTQVGPIPEALTARRTRSELARTIIYRGKRYDI
jgi:predicted regulator of Ras-like GTPase activity (Roadblock/LC7/MglB family)